MDWQNWIPALTSSGVVAFLGLGLGYLWKATIEKGISHAFDAKLEQVKSDLRAQETSLADVRSGALAAMSAKHQELDRRRVAAAAELWAATVKQGQANLITAFVAGLNLSVMNERIKRGGEESRKLMQLADSLWTSSGGDGALAAVTNDISPQRLFLPPDAWQAYHALRSIHSLSLTMLTTWRSGMDASGLIKTEVVRDLLKSVLPHRAEYLDKYPEGGQLHLLGELEEKVLKCLLDWLEDSSSHVGMVDKASRIMGRAENLQASIALRGLPKELRVDPPDLPVFR